ncbi:unnamed protein product [Psylliodes chrysocephalus]|uniref:Uncharacterized protein n=1 Tax=Psylliodes chrysocephalus TaxID=3402493 RepID=A0A9P0CPS1_9CUCU|nr:unnamed protein product [Psylliodes chrysocephala]
MNMELRKQFKDVQILQITKPGATLGQVIENIEMLVKDFSFKDYVIVMGDANDFLLDKYPSMRFLNFKLKQCTNTNLILLSMPKINKNNNRVFKFISKLQLY